MASGITLNFARLEIARTHVSAARPLKRALVDVAVIASEALKVERISTWRFLDDRQAIQCQCLFQQGQLGVADGAILRVGDFPRYFNALNQRRVVKVRNVSDDPMAAEFREPYFEPLGICAMLDAPVYVDGVMAAVVCHEHIGPPRDWSSEEAEFAGSVADAVARLYGESRFHRSQDNLGSARRQVDQLSAVAALGQLAAGIAHDFGNILLAARGHAELIAHHAEAGPQIRQLASDVSKAADSGRELVSSLLQLGHRNPAKPRVIDVEAMLQEAEPLLRMAAGDGVSLTVEAEPGLARVLIDPVELQRALINLVVNAREAMPAGGIIRCRAVPIVPANLVESGPHVCIEVEDQGPGLSPEVAARAFEPYFSAKGATHSGLGLSIVQQTVVMAGGSVEASSRPGRGTVVRLVLPAIGVPVPSLKR